MLPNKFVIFFRFIAIWFENLGGGVIYTYELIYFSQVTFEIGITLMTILQMREMEHRELSNLPKATKPARGRSRVQIHYLALRMRGLIHCTMLPLLKEHPTKAVQEVQPDFQSSSWQRASWGQGNLKQEALCVPP